MAEIVKVERRHWPAWHAMREALYPECNPETHLEEMESVFASEEWAVFIAEEDGGRAVGMIELSLRNIADGCGTSPVGYVEGIYVAPEARGRGLGRLLIDVAVEFFCRVGCREMASDTELGNAEAQDFHRALGFEETGRVVQFRMTIPREHDLP